MRKIFLYLLMFALIYQGISTFVYAKDNVHEKQEVEHVIDDGGHEHEQGHDEGHGPGMEPLLFIIIALIIGAGTRYLLRRSFLPYTVSLLIIGILLGMLVRMGFLEHSFITMSEAVKWAGNIDPHLILYVFLPTLIFEAAFAMDVHTFKKSFANASIMAIPGIIIALVLAGALVMLLNSWNIGLSGWGWPVALLFGTVISATDPVAVVALLKDLGASKKLGTLIEGESLLNDGSAIVIFMVLLTGITGQVAGNSPVVEFLKVAFGGALLGVVIGYITMSWVGKVFNDALVEISVMIAAAYLIFFIAEYFLHVSGVLGVVSFGLIMAGNGRTKISPGVEHFLHEFWELAAFIANTLIFLIVGLVIAQQTVFLKSDFLILIIVYVGIHVIRAFVIIVFFPAMKKVGYGIKKKETYILWWGALRGAIGLALALVVAGVDNQYIPETIRNQFLFLTAGVVTMTLVINATTIGWLVDKLGITKLSPAKAAMIHHSRQYLRQAVENRTVKMKSDRYINRANWQIVEQYYPDVPEEIESEHAETNTISEIRRRILEKEKSSYWHQFKDGMIGEGAVRILTDAINELLDSGGKIPLSERDDLEKLWQTPSLLHKLEKIPFLKKIAEKVFFDKLLVSYDAARGFLEAQKEALNMVGSMYRSIEDQNEEACYNLDKIEEEINENQIHSQTFIRNLRKNYPEIYTAIATRQATRSMLNYEIKTVERLKKNGQISKEEAEKMVAGIEERMKKLIQKPPKATYPEVDDVVNKVSWLKDLNSSDLNQITNQFQNQVFSVGEQIMKEGTIGDSVHIILRGTVKITHKKQLLEVLGPGSTLGEMSVMTGMNRKATVIAESPVTTLKIKVLKFQRLMQDFPSIKHKLWNIVGKRFAKQLIANSDLSKMLEEKNFEMSLEKGEIAFPKKMESIKIGHKQWVVLIHGKAISDNEKKKYSAPHLFTNLSELTAIEEDTVLFEFSL